MVGGVEDSCGPSWRQAKVATPARRIHGPANKVAFYGDKEPPAAV